MPVATGLVTLAGFEPEARVASPTWPATAPARVLQVLPLLSGTLHEGVQKSATVTTAAALGPTDSDITGLLPTADLTIQMRYQGLEGLVACALGDMAPGLPTAIGLGAYRHVYSCDALLSTAARWPDGTSKVRRGTLAVQRGVSVWEFVSCMIQSLSWHGTAQGVSCQVSLVAHSLSRASTSNTPDTMATLAQLGAPNALFPDLVLLADGQALGVSEWTVHLANHLAAAPGPRTGLAREEYEREAAPEVTGSFTLPRYEADDLVNRWATTGTVALTLTHTGPPIPGTALAYQHTLTVPRAALTSVQPSGPAQGFASLPVEWRALATADAGPLTVAIVSGESRHMLLL